MQEIKLLVLDIDGTLIADIGSSIAPVDLDAIRRAQAAGVKVTIATGRILGTAKKWIGILNIDGPIITCNGADIRDLENRISRIIFPCTIQGKFLPPTKARE